MLQLHQVAEIVHETNRTLSRVLGHDVQPAWADAPERMRKDTQDLILRTLAQPSRTAEQEHIEWAQQKAADGWQYGPKKDEAAKTHPMLIPYSELPESQRLKDAVLPAVILALSAPMPF